MKAALFLITLLWVRVSFSQTLYGDNYKTLFQKDSGITIERKPTSVESGHVEDYEVVVFDSASKMRIGYWFSHSWKLKNVGIIYDTLMLQYIPKKGCLTLITTPRNKINGYHFLVNKKNKLVAILKYKNGVLENIIYIDDKKKLDKYREEHYLFIWEVQQPPRP